MKKKILALLLAALMVVSLLPTVAFAENVIDSINLGDISIGSGWAGKTVSDIEEIIASNLASDTTLKAVQIWDLEAGELFTEGSLVAGKSYNFGFALDAGESTFARKGGPQIFSFDGTITPTPNGSKLVGDWDDYENWVNPNWPTYCNYIDIWYMDIEVTGETPAGPTGDTVSYVDENGDVKSATAVKLESGNTSWSGWLYVDPATKINDKITLTGDTSLIVKDGMQQSTNWCYAYGGIDTGSYTLTIYGQSEGTGRFIFWGINGINSEWSYEGEGTDGTSGGDAQVTFVGNLTVCGATVGVYGGVGGNGGDGDYGGDGDSGVDGGSGGDGGKSAAAINGTITVKGGDVTVKGGQGGYGGGGGWGGDGNDNVDPSGDGGDGGDGGNGTDGAVAIIGSAVIYGGKLTVTGGGGGWGGKGGDGGDGGDDCGEWYNVGGVGGDGGKGGNGGKGAVAVIGTVEVYGGEATLTGGTTGYAGDGGSVGDGGDGESSGGSGSFLGGGTNGAAGCAMNPATAGDVTVAGGTLTLTGAAMTATAVAVESAVGLPAAKDVDSIEVKAYNAEFAEWNGTDPLTGFYAIRITAEKAAAHSVTTQVASSNGTVTAKINGSPVTQAEAGASVVFTATPLTGYEFAYWEVIKGGVNIEAVKTNRSITVIMPDADLTLTAHFKAVESDDDDHDWDYEKLAKAGMVAAGVVTTVVVTKIVVDRVHAIKSAYDAAAEVTPEITVEEMPMVAIGDSGDAVTTLQAELNAQGYDCGEADGIFGQNTLNAVIAFQTANGLAADGIVGELTWAALL